MFESLPSERHQRWELMKEFISRWYSPLTATSGFERRKFAEAEQRLGFALPRALREWYCLAGRRDDVWSQQDKLLSPDKLSVRDGNLIFFIENQAVVRWGIPLSQIGQDDPPVVIEDTGGASGWIIENATTSEFALQMLLFSSKWANFEANWGNGLTDEASIGWIEANYPRLAFPDWHWPTYPTRFFCKNDLYVEIDGSGDDSWIWVWSKSDREFREFERAWMELGRCWESSWDEGV